MSEWTPEDDVKLSDFVRKDGYETWKKRMERMIGEFTAEMIRTRNISLVEKIEALTTAILICDNARD